MLVLKENRINLQKKVDFSWKVCYNRYINVNIEFIKGRDGNMNSKYSTFLTILLVVIIVAIVGVIGFLGFRYISSINSKKEAENFVDTFQKPNETEPTA